MQFNLLQNYSTVSEFNPDTVPVERGICKPQPYKPCGGITVKLSSQNVRAVCEADRIFPYRFELTELYFIQGLCRCAPSRVILFFFQFLRHNR